MCYHNNNAYVKQVWLSHDLLPTTVDFALARNGNSLLEAYDQWREWADEKVCCDYSLHLGVSWWSPHVSDEMEVLVKEKGICILSYWLCSYNHMSVCSSTLYIPIYKHGYIYIQPDNIFVQGNNYFYIQTDGYTERYSYTQTEWHDGWLKGEEGCVEGVEFGVECLVDGVGFGV